MLINGNNRRVSLRGSTMPVPYQCQLSYLGTLMLQKLEREKNGARLVISFYIIKVFMRSPT